MHRLICTNCGWGGRVNDYSEIDIPPRCPSCSGIARPEVVFFGEPLPYEKTQVLSQELERGFDIYFSIGTTSVFPYIQQPILKARSLGRSTIEINPQDTEVSEAVDIRLRMRSAQALSAIYEGLTKGN